MIVINLERMIWGTCNMHVEMINFGMLAYGMGHLVGSELNLW